MEIYKSMHLNRHILSQIYLSLSFLIVCFEATRISATTRELHLYQGDEPPYRRRYNRLQ